MEVQYYDKGIETADREALDKWQFQRLKAMLAQVLGTNSFYRAKFQAVGLEDPNLLSGLHELPRLPFTTKDELVADQQIHPPYGTNLTFDLRQYRRYHQTSGTTGEPIRVLDAQECWEWWRRCWGYIYKAANVGEGDRVFFAFSFGPFIGFWSAFDAASIVGATAIPGGGQTSLQRLMTLQATHATVLVCTPTYALRLAEVARDNGIDLVSGSVRVTIHAGEPGASIPSTKARIQEAWGARAYDHIGLTEVGAWGIECVHQPGGVHVNEAEFIMEVIDPATGRHAQEGEMVVTNLGRLGMPAIRYRTGDKVRLMSGQCPCGRTFRRLQGGVIGRIDDMIIIRGMNVFPSAVENILRRFQGVDEFAVEIYRDNEMDEMDIKIEISAPAPETVAQAIAREVHTQMGFRPKVTLAPANSLPRFELKARRFVDRRK